MFIDVHTLADMLSSLQQQEGLQTGRGAHVCTLDAGRKQNCTLVFQPCLRIFCTKSLLPSSAISWALQQSERPCIDNIFQAIEALRRTRPPRAMTTVLHLHPILTSFQWGYQCKPLHHQSKSSEEHPNKWAPHWQRYTNAAFRRQAVIACLQVQKTLDFDIA